MRILLTCIATLFFFASYAQVDSIANFKTTEYSFGKIKQNTPVTTEFAFVNKGDKPLIIEVATAECGCTTPDYPKTPIQKGKTAVIKVTYNAENPGKFTKRVNVKFANIATPVVLTISGEVIEKS
jgi:hypothetical protein